MGEDDYNQAQTKETDQINEKTSQDENELKKEPKRTLFNDLRRFKNSIVTILTFGGEAVQGKLLGYDEVANCVLESKNNRRFVVFGKSITMVCEGDLHSL